MFSFLRQLSKGAVRVVHPPVTAPAPIRPVYLRKRLNCKVCGSPMLLKRFVPLHPAGVRGYYVCNSGHDAAVDRDRVRRCSHQSSEKVFFSE